MRGDGATNFDDGLTSFKAVIQVVEIGLKTFPGGENKACFGHFFDVRGAWLKGVDVHSWFADFDDFDALSSHLFDGIGDEGVERGDIQAVRGKREE